jgi:hypothetical protein
MGRPAERIDAQRQSLRGICLVVDAKRQPAFGRAIRQPDASSPAIDEFPRRPDPTIMSQSIPLYFVARNKAGLWVVREAEGRSGGVFLFKHSALRYATKRGAAAGCATMFLRERFELDVENRGNPLVAWLDAALRRVAKLVPDHPPPMPIRRSIFRGERQ